LTYHEKWISKIVNEEKDVKPEIVEIRRHVEIWVDSFLYAHGALAKAPRHHSPSVKLMRISAIYNIYDICQLTAVILLHSNDLLKEFINKSSSMKDPRMWIIWCHFSGILMHHQLWHHQPQRIAVPLSQGTAHDQKFLRTRSYSLAQKLIDRII